MFKKKKNCSTTIKVKMLYYDVENTNNRIYTRECALKMLEQANEDIHNGNFLGELGYPERFEVALDRVSHRVTEMHLNEKDKCLEGTITILETPCGRNILRALDGDIDKFNDYFVVRSRASGIVNEDKTVELEKLYTFDIIPKTEDAFKNVTNDKRN